MEELNTWLEFIIIKKYHANKRLIYLKKNDLDIS